LSAFVFAQVTGVAPNIYRDFLCARGLLLEQKASTQKR